MARRTLRGRGRGPRLRREIERLETSRLSVLDQWLEAQLGLGRHAELVSELTGLVARYRTNEPLHAHLMVALLRCGQHDEALIVYERLRVALRSESGMEPSARLRRLQRSVLAVRDTAGRRVYGPRIPAQYMPTQHVPGPYAPDRFAAAPYAPGRARLVPAGSVG